MGREGVDGTVTTLGELGAQLGNNSCTHGGGRREVISDGKRTYPHTDEKEKQTGEVSRLPSSKCADPRHWAESQGAQGGTTGQGGCLEEAGEL